MNFVGNSHARERRLRKTLRRSFERAGLLRRRLRPWRSLCEINPEGSHAAPVGSVWIVEPDNSIVPGIVPKTFDPSDSIPTLALCPTMPEITVNRYPFLFSGSTLPGVSPLAVRDGTVYYYTPCARGIYGFPDLRVS